VGACKKVAWYDLELDLLVLKRIVKFVGVCVCRCCCILRQVTILLRHVKKEGMLLCKCNFDRAFAEVLRLIPDSALKHDKLQESDAATELLVVVSCQLS